MLTWRTHRLDAALLLLSALILATVLPGGTAAEQVSGAGSAAVLLMFLARRIQPLAVSLLAFGTMCLGISQMSEINPAQFVGILVVFALVGAVNSERDAVLAWVAGALTMAYATSRQPPGGRLADYALTLTFCTMIWTAGLLVSRRDRHAALADERAKDAERSRSEHARAATAAERGRIATELHDIVSHGLSVVIVQTVAARQELDDGAAADAGRRLGAVEETAREALSDMRRMLGLLQASANDSATAATDPSPGLANLPRLVERATQTGLTVSMTGLESAGLAELPTGLQLAVYRTLQEALTNVIRHAPASDVTIRLQRERSWLEIEVVNGPAAAPPTTATGAGRGLIGLQQRCEVYGGTFTAEPLADGGFRVSARLPLVEPAHRDAPLLAAEST